MSEQQDRTPTAGWIEHRREDDGELLGLLVPCGDRFIATTVFGRPLSNLGARAETEQVLDSVGLSYLAERWRLRLPDQTHIHVEITEASPAQVVLKNVDFGSDHSYGQRFFLPAPVDDRLELA